MEEEPKRYFTVKEAEALIPRLEEIVGPILDAHQRVTALGELLQDEQRRIAAAGGFSLDVDTWRQRKAALDYHAKNIEDGVTEILSAGAVPKDLGTGLVDFPFMLDGREVNLCWRYGEKEIKYWHDLEEGFKGRKALGENP
jgi:hypothetical protein